MSVKGIVAEQRCRCGEVCGPLMFIYTAVSCVCVRMDVCVDMHGQELRRKLQNK